MWEETDGPSVQKPARRGFGTRLIERSLAQDLGGEVRIEFAPTGVVCSVDAPLTQSSMFVIDGRERQSVHAMHP
jgi:two-component sensor histidine kinase